MPEYGHPCACPLSKIFHHTTRLTPTSTKHQIRKIGAFMKREGDRSQKSEAGRKILF
jgi:hypothetical protein